MSIRYLGAEVVTAGFPDDVEEQLIEFPNAPALEAFLEEGRGYLLSEQVCPLCGTHMVEVAKVGPVPVDLQGLVACLNQGCNGREVYYLPGDPVQQVTKADFTRALAEARKRGRVYFGLPG